MAPSLGICDVPVPVGPKKEQGEDQGMEAWLCLGFPVLKMGLSLGEAGPANLCNPQL